MADYDRVYYDDETGASLSLKMFEEATQERDEPEHSLRTRSRSRLRSHSNWDTMGLHEQGRHRSIWRTRFWHLLQSYLLRNFGFFSEGRWQARKEVVTHFHSPIRRKVANTRWSIMPIRNCHAQPCDVHIAQFFDLYFERTMEKLDCNIGVFNLCVYKHLVEDISVLRHCDTYSDRGIEGTVEQNIHFLKAHCNIGSETTTPWMMWSTISESCATGLCRRLGKRQNVLKSKLSQVTQKCQSKNAGLQSNEKSAHTTRAAKKTVYAQSSFITICTCQLIELNCNLPVENVEALKRCTSFLLKCRRCFQSFETRSIVPMQITCFSDSNFARCYFFSKHLVGNYLCRRRWNPWWRIDQMPEPPIPEGSRRCWISLKDDFGKFIRNSEFISFDMWFLSLDKVDSVSWSSSQADGSKSVCLLRLSLVSRKNGR